MNSRKYIVFTVIRLLILSVFVLGTTIIAVYPFHNRDLRLIMDTEKGIFQFNKSANEIINEEKVTFSLAEVDEINFKELKIYGNFNSMYTKKIEYNEFANYVSDVKNGQIQWHEEEIIINGVNSIHLTMNEQFSKMLKQQSASFMQERLVMMELLLILCAMALIICKVIDEKLNPDKRDNHGPIYEMKKFCSDIRKYGQYMIYAAKTDLRAEVANSYLNRLWWLLEPFFNMLVYVIVFGKVMGKSVENYATFIFAALLMWNFFSKTVNYSVKLVRNNKEIISKVYVPKFILLLSNMFLNFFKLLFSLIVLVVMLIIFKVQIGVNVLWIIPAYIVMTLLAFGLGMIFLHFGVYVDDLSYAVGILLNMLMFLSGIFYEVMTTLPEPLNTLLMCLNPVAMFIDTMRNGLLNNTAANLPILGIWLILSIILCFIGVHIVYKNENGYVKVV